MNKNQKDSLSKFQFVFQRLFLPGLILLACTCLIICGCSKKKDEKASKKELLIYCGITMIKPMSEIATLIENQENCKIKIIKDGSGNLLKSILYNKTGDMYLPGSEKYFKTIETDHKGVVTEKVFVGYNTAVIMVQKGNPKGITSDLLNLADNNYGVVIGNPDSGSIGRETKKILQSRGIFESVIMNIMSLTTDSKDLVKVIKDKEADIVINWYAASTWDENMKYIDTIEIDRAYAEKNKLIIGLLKFSRHPNISKKFMFLAASSQGQKIFNKYGLAKSSTEIEQGKD